ncbi:MAG: S8 family serine peptidase, partial [Anaerolineales bacterium]
SGDAHGWNFLFGGSNNIWDDNGHGTHVSGILGAETENGIGIAGVVPKCRLMVLKAFQSNGTGNDVDISNAILYAIEHGASLINMSFGTYAHPTAMKQALEVAYSSALLVAAAGNDGLPIEGVNAAPFFPAALNYVIGVQALDRSGNLATFSNYDPSGPFASNNIEQLNYEVAAPGVNIFSILPINQYGYMTGTSMATPIITGIACLLKNLHPDWSNDQTFVQLVNGCNPPLNAYTALSITFPPRLNLTSYSIIDTLDGNRNGLPDAGETIQMPFTVQNLGSQADSIYVSLKLDPLENQSLIKMQDSVEFFGSLAPRASRSNTTHPFVFKIDPSVQNERSVHLDYSITCKEQAGQVTGSFYITVVHGTDLNGLITSDFTLTSDKYYVVTGNVLVTNNATLTIMPGTTIRLQSGATIEASGGKIMAVGTYAQKITFTASDPPKYWGFISVASTNSQFKYCIFEYGSGLNTDNTFIHSTINELFDHCEMRYCQFGGPLNNNSYGLNLQYCFIHDNSSDGGLIEDTPQQIFTHNTIVDNVFPYSSPTVGYLDLSNAGFPNSTHGYNNVFDNITPYQAVASAGSGLFQAPLNYWGTSDSATVHNEFEDFTVNANFRFALVRPFLSNPDPSAPPVVDSVWLSPVPPVGAEVETLTVRFSRPMDTTQHPQVSFGVASPFTQYFVPNGRWIDSSTWFGSYPFSLTTGDGIYTIRVANANSPDGFTMAEEKQRFRFLVAVAGGASSQLAAFLDTIGVKLYWTRTKAPDIGGYLLYRALQVSDTTAIDTIQASTSLLRDTTYVDSNVKNGNIYWYMLATLNTDMNEIIRTKPFKIK